MKDEGPGTWLLSLFSGYGERLPVCVSAKPVRRVQESQEKGMKKKVYLFKQPDFIEFEV